MKKLSFVLILILFGSVSVFCQSISDVSLSGEYEDRSLKEILDEIEKEHHVTFFYQEDWVSGIKVTRIFQNKPLIKVIRDILYEHNLSLIVFNPYSIFVLNTTPESAKPIENSLIDVNDSIESNVLGIETIVVGQTQSNRLANATLSGYIKEASTGEEIVGGTLYVEQLKKGTSSNAKGFYSIDLPVGIYDITFSSIGLKDETRHLILKASGEVNIELFEEAVQMENVIISGEAEDVNISSTRMSMTKLDMKTIEKMPAFLGEVDVIKSLILLPSVSTIGEGASGFNVRGGDIDQNLILLDGAPVFNSSHVFGFFSVFNPDVVKEVTLYTGGISAKYGGRLSSILDIKQKEGNLEKVTGKGGLGIVSSRLTLEAPIVKNKSSVLIAGRTSYSDWMLKKAPDLNVKNSSAAFYDLTAKINYTFNDENKLSLSTYLGQDKFRLGLDTTYHWGSANAVLKYSHVWSEKLFSDFTAVYSKYSYKVDNQDENNAFELQYDIIYKGLKADFTYFLQKHQIDFGANAIRYEFQPGFLKPTTDVSSVNSVKVENEQSREVALYINDEYKINSKISLMYGLRYSMFQNLGPANVYTYRSGIPKDPGFITDTLQFSKGAIIKTYGGFEPRLSVKIGLGLKSSLKLSYNRMRQYISIISNTSSMTPIDIWKTSDKHIKPQIGDQIIVGYFRNFANNSIEGSIETYYKKTSNLVEYKDGANLLLNETLEADLLEGKGRAYGIELQVKKKTGRLTGWGSYVYSRTERKVNGGSSEEKINFGEYYPSNYDKPHSVKVVSEYKISQRWSFSTNFTYGTGRPFTAPFSKFKINSGFLRDVTVANFSQRNQYRIPDYHRLDISVTLDEGHRKNRKWKGSWTLSVYNVYGRKNPYSVFFRNADGVPPQPYKLAILGTPFPALTYNFNF